jgi:hypothetical protein
MTSSSRRCKAQSAFEFMFIFGALLGALITGFWFSWSKSMEAKRFSTELQVDELLNAVSEKINTAWLEGRGFSTNLTIPFTVSDREYSLNLSSNYIYLTLGDTVYMKPLITQNVTGSFTMGAVNGLTNMGDYILIS